MKFSLKSPKKAALMSLAAVTVVGGMTAATAFAASPVGTSPGEIFRTAQAQVAQQDGQSQRQQEHLGKASRPFLIVRGVGQELGLEKEAMLSELQAGKTLAQIITDNGGDVDAVVDALVTRAEAMLQEAVDAGRITPEQRDEVLPGLEERITAVVNEATWEGLVERIEERGADNKRPHRNALHIVRSIGQEYGLDRPGMAAQLQEGQSLAQIITDNGGSPDAFEAALTAQLESRLQEGVDAGRITLEQKDDRLAQFQARLSDFLDNDLSEWAGERFGDHDRRSDPQGEASHQPQGMAEGILGVVAGELGLEVPDVATQLQGGQTLAQIIVDNGGSVEAVVDALTAQAKVKFQEAVDSGRITPEQKDDRLADMKERFLRQLERSPAGQGQADGS